jgi:aspartate 1-decarboxylase
MQRIFLKSKIHRAAITQAELNYEGSLTIDLDLMEAAGMEEFEMVSVVNINNGERFETYIIAGERASGVMCLNGAAARKAVVGDRIIVMTYCNLTNEEIPKHKPRIVIVDEKNQIKSLSDKVFAGKFFEQN